MKIYLIIKTERFEVSEDKETFMYSIISEQFVEQVDLYNFVRTP